MIGKADTEIYFPIGYILLLLLILLLVSSSDLGYFQEAIKVHVMICQSHNYCAYLSDVSFISSLVIFEETELGRELSSLLK